MLWKDYALVGGEGAEDGSGPAWYVPRIDRKELRKLMKRSDWPAAGNYALWIALVFALGSLTVAAWGSAFGIPLLVLYSAVHQSATARQHELAHGTPFRTRRINEILYHATSYVTLNEGHFYRWRHARHHTHTIIVGKDPEIQSMRPPAFVTLILNVFNLTTVPASVRAFVLRATGRLGEAVHFVPESERPTVVRAARVYLALLALTAGASLVLASWLPLLLTVGPRVIGAPLYAFLHFTQHAGLDEDVYDHRLNSRTVYLNPVLRFLYANMNYHVEHHMFPMVPYYRLPALHALIEDQCPPARNGLLEAYREIVPALIRQRRDPAHFIRPQLPAGAPPAPA